MREVSGLVTQTALAIRDEDELEAAASMLDAALRRAKAEMWREAARELHSKSKAIRTEAVTWCWGETAEQLSRIAFDYEARAAQIEEGEDLK